MVDDDGRYIHSGCVPYAISQAGGVPMDRAVEVCRAHGWVEGNGIDEDLGVAAAIACGLEMVERTAQQVAGALTLRKLFDRLSPSSSYRVGRGKCKCELHAQHDAAAEIRLGNTLCPRPNLAS